MYFFKCFKTFILNNTNECVIDEIPYKKVVLKSTKIAVKFWCKGHESFLKYFRNFLEVFASVCENWLNLFKYGWKNIKIYDIYMEVF